jgi:hypothetical protein
MRGGVSHCETQNLQMLLLAPVDVGESLGLGQSPLVPITVKYAAEAKCSGKGPFA